jgi:hypothetical protein
MTEAKEFSSNVKLKLTLLAQFWQDPNATFFIV